MKDRFYLACFRDNVGSSVAFHAIDGRGYTTNIDMAHQFTREEAQRTWENAREFDQPISADHVDELAVFRVDCQRIPRDSVYRRGVVHVAYAKNRWDGNDVFWYSAQCTSPNFSEAWIFPKYSESVLSLDPSKWVILPWALVNFEKRRTFQQRFFNKRIMVQGAGLITPERIKRERRRKNSGKTMFNCPGCGKIHWQYNPYDFEGCQDPSCKEFSS